MDAGADPEVTTACLVALRAEEAEKVGLPPRRLAE
jgi:hypothetical protein